MKAWGWWLKQRLLSWVRVRGTCMTILCTGLVKYKQGDKQDCNKAGCLALTAIQWPQLWLCWHPTRWLSCLWYSALATNSSEISSMYLGLTRSLVLLTWRNKTSLLDILIPIAASRSSSRWMWCMHDGMQCSERDEGNDGSQEELGLTMPTVVVVECILLCFSLPFCGIRSPCRRVVKWLWLSTS